MFTKLAEFENTENPELQVDNFSTYDGEVEQPIHEGPQTRSRTRKLMKANCLIANLFDIGTDKICDDVSEIVTVHDFKSVRDLILDFWYKQVFMIVSVVTWLKPGHILFVASRDFWLNHSFSGGGGVSMDCL